MTDTRNRSAKGLGIPLLTAAVCLIAMACWVLASGDHLPGKPKQADEPVAPDKVLDFVALYATHCAACHGADGKLGPAPPLNDPLFRAIVPQFVVEQVITVGRPGTPMPGFDREHGGALTAAQIQVLTNQIKGTPYKLVEPPANVQAEVKVVEDAGGVAPIWGSVDPAPVDAPPYSDPDHQSVRTSQDYETIRTTVFARACAECHGDGGKGAKIAGAINDPNFLALASDVFLRRVVITGRPDVGMPDYKSARKRPSDFKPLKSADIDGLVALLRHWQSGNSSDGK